MSRGLSCSELDMQEVFLKPGDFWFGEGPVLVRTLLGSCVSIVMWHPLRRLGGMCHIMLPCRSQACSSPLDGRYADEAMLLFQQEAQKYRVRLSEMQVKLFGGGNMFPAHAIAFSPTIGERNVEIARELLTAQGLSVCAEHVGGYGHRRLVFDVQSGDVYVGYGASLQTPRRGSA